MKDIIEKLNKAFESRIKLGIMSTLMVNEEADFNSLKEMLQVSDGNLASHLNALESEKYIKVTKKFVGKKTNTSYHVTEKGEKAFREHLDALEKLLKQT